jgi:hypothetical protein
MSMLSGAYIEQRKFAAAVEVAQKQARLEEQFGRGDTSQHLNTLQNLAALRLMTGEVAQSMVDRAKVNQLMRKFEEELPPIYAANQAILLIRLARAPEALQLSSAALERARAVNDPNAVLQLLHIRVWAGLEAGDLDSADQALREAQPLLDQGLGNPGLHSHFALRRAQLALARKDAAAARSHADQALSLAGYQSQRPQRSLAHGLLGAGAIALASGRAADAARYASEALRLSESVARGAETSADVGEALLLLAKATPERRRANLQRAVRCLGSGLGADHPLTLEARNLLQSDGA